MDVMSNISEYDNAATVYWMQNSDGSYSPQKLAEGTTVHIGGAVAYDRTGDGYLDFVLGDSASDSITFVENNAGTLSVGVGSRGSMPASGAFAVQNGLGTSSVTGTSLPTSLSIFNDVSTVDLDNNGTIDILANVNYNGAALVGDASKGLAILYNSGTSAGFTYVNAANVFEGGSAARDDPNSLMSMTYADFNGDGWLDLYMNRGAKAGVASNESRIYLNDGTGKLNTADAQAMWFGDTRSGGASFAIDWNLDGKLDVVEVPAQAVAGTQITLGAPVVLYLNTGTGVWGTSPVGLSPAYTNITGAEAVDYDWDGSIDLILYRAGVNATVGATDNASPSILIRNTNIAADGTSMHVRILDDQGINSYFGNTVKLYDSTGTLVSTQVINPQSSAASNSTGLVSFYGLNPNETYSVQLLRISNNASDNVGGVANLGGYNNATINTTWSGLTAGKANEAFVLTAEAGTATNSSVSNPSGIVGTGYNDHFFASLGNDHYNGGGGWVVDAAGQAQWVAVGGQDTLDYTHLNGTFTVDTSAGTVTKVIGGVTSIDTFENIENFIFSNGNNIFNGSGAGETISGGSGTDIYNIGSGGSDTIYFKLLSLTDATGGNGSDIVNGFHVGKVGTDTDADIIDIHELLNNYTGTAGLYTDTDGVKLDIASTALQQYLNVSSDGTNTYIEIDRNGGGSFTTVLTMNSVQTDLVTLLLNNQIVI